MNANKTGSFIARLRQERGMTQRQLAEALLVSDKAVSKWETGRGMPDIENLEALADALDVSVAELLHGERIEGPVAPNEAGELAQGGLDLARELLQRRSVANALLGFLAGLVVVALVVVHLTSPISLHWHDGLIRVEGLSDGTLVAMTDEDVAGWNVGEIDGQAFVSCHTTRWHQLAGTPGERMAAVGDAAQVEAVLYYPGTPDDVLVWGEMDDAGVVTLPRLVYNMWLVIGLVATAVGLAAWALTRRRWYARHVLRAALLPASFSVALVAVLWGNFDKVYDASFYLSGICLVGLTLWAACLVALARMPSAARRERT